MSTGSRPRFRFYNAIAGGITIDSGPLRTEQHLDWRSCPNNEAIIAGMIVQSNSHAILCSSFGDHQGYGKHVSPKFSFTMLRSSASVVPSLLRSKTLG